MLLTRVTLKDYGVYRGTNEFDLECTQDKPIILIGGTNGAGKTTLFEAIVLCFHGINMFKKINTRAYEDYLAKKIHRYSDGTTAESASVTVQFRFYHNGKDTEYRVRREIGEIDGRVKDELYIEKRYGKKDKFAKLDAIEDVFWQSFIEDLIPRGIASLFFFDGEKIAEIAEEESEDLAIKVSFSTLLGLDVVMQLGADLQTNLMRNLVVNDKAARQEIERYTKERDENIEHTEHLRERLVQKRSELDRIHSDIRELDEKIARIGGEFAHKRQESKGRLESKMLSQEIAAKRIQEMCGSVLPLCLVPEQLEDLQEQIRQDEQVQKKRLEQEIVQSKLEELDKRLQSDSFWREYDLGPSDRDGIRAKVLSSLDSQTPDKAGQGVFDFSQSQASKIIHMIGEAEAMLPRLEVESQEFLRLGQDIAQIQTALVNAPSDYEIGPMISQLQEMNRQAGVLQAEIDHIETTISSDESMLKHLNVKLRDAVSKKYKNKRSRTKAELTQKVQKVLDKYIDELRLKKLALLEQYLLDAIHLLMHKQNLVGRVSIDPSSFIVTLYRENGEPLAKDMLSKGEKQMFATAVLWALAKTSGRPLPFVIDTPLARLDRSHRDNMIQRFFPLASHQTIILSTDTEIERGYYKALAPYTARSYVTEFASDEGRAQVYKGYFWGRKEVLLASG